MHVSPSTGYRRSTKFQTCSVDTGSLAAMELINKIGPFPKSSLWTTNAPKSGFTLFIPSSAVFLSTPASTQTSNATATFCGCSRYAKSLKSSFVTVDSSAVVKAVFRKFATGAMVSTISFSPIIIFPLKGIVFARESLTLSKVGPISSKWSGRALVITPI